MRLRMMALAGSFSSSFLYSSSASPGVPIISKYMPCTAAAQAVRQCSGTDGEAMSRRWKSGWKGRWKGGKVACGETVPQLAVVGIG